MTRYAYFQGQIVPIEDAKISIMAHVVNYGTGCFEGIRAYWSPEKNQLFIFRPLEHYQRLLRSMRIMMMSEPMSAQKMVEITIELLRKEGFQEDTYIRPLAYKSSNGIGVRLHNLEDALAIFALPFGAYIQSADSARAGVSSWRRLDDNAIPARAKITGSYVNAAFSKTEAMLHGYDEAIVLTQDGHVSEGSAENFFLVRDGALITSPVTDNILEGITRDTIMRIASEQFHLPIIERHIDRSELYTADEAFFCGTGVQLVAVTQIDHRPVGAGVMGPITTQLQKTYFDVVCGRVERYSEWCVPVY